MQKVLFRRLADVNCAVSYNLLNAEEYFTILQTIFTFFFWRDLRARFRRGQLTLSRYFYNLVSASIATAFVVLQTHACIKRRKSSTGSIALPVGKMLFSALFFQFGRNAWLRV